jgi:serine/threonine-protein kinase
MVTGSGLVKVLDFGLAKLTDVSSQLDVTSDGEQNTLTTAPLTREGSIMGTVNYMSPEQAEGLKVDARSDIFSFGAVLYEMVTGRRAFDGDSGISTLSAVLRDEVKPIHEMAPDVPVELADIVNRCLRKNPAARWQSMAEVEAELIALKRRSEFPAPATAPVVVAALPHQNTSQKSAIPKAILLGAVCLAVLALAVGMAWWSTRPKQPAETVAAPAPVPAAVAPVPAAVAPAPAPPAPQAVATAAPAPASANVKPMAPAIKPAAPPPVSAPVSAPIVTEPVTPPPPPRAAPVAPAIRAAAPAKLVSVTLSDGIPFRIALLEDVPNDSQVGRPLRFRVLDDVQSGNTTVIAKGSTVSGTLADLGGKRNFFGERSKVRFRLIAAQSVDDVKINVRATPARRADGVETRPFAKANGGKDKELIATSGTEYIAYISGDQTVSVHK